MTIPIVIVLALLFAIIPYIAYVEEADDLIIDTLHRDTVETLLQIFYIIGISLSFPIQLFPISDAFGRSTYFDDYFTSFREHPRIKFAIGAVVTICLCIAISLVIPDLGTYANMVGAVFG